MNANQIIINQTKAWVINVVVGCNFCPFAAKEVKKNSLHYVVENSEKIQDCLSALLKEYQRLDNNLSIETTLVIFPHFFKDFDDYLSFLHRAEKALQLKKYEGIYQLAGFHPLYQFADSTLEDPANYTNRSPYPMIHILREESVERAIASFPHIEKIPERNIHFTRSKGLAYMKQLMDTILKSN
ncbi:MAG: DUF1415 domain-containing protein [Ginsengibacter sp.]|jgi:hypothetical protein